MSPALDTASQRPDSEASTRARILDAAEVLFSERGYAGTVVRDITCAAGVNVASVNYHFQGKRNLYLEVFRRRIPALREGRLRAIRGQPAGGEPQTLEELVRSFVEHFIRDLYFSRTSTHFMNLVFREVSQPGPAFELVTEEMILPVQRAFCDALCRTRPDLNRDEAILCIGSVIGQIIHFLRAREVISLMSGRRFTRPFVDRISRHITEFSLRGIGGPG